MLAVCTAMGLARQVHNLKEDNRILRAKLACRAEPFFRRLSVAPWWRADFWRGCSQWAPRSLVRLLAELISET